MPHSLHFPGHLGGAAKADIALDDIKFLSSTCDCKLHHKIILSVILCLVTPSEAAPKPDTTPTTVPPTGSFPHTSTCPQIFAIYLVFIDVSCLFTVPSTPAPTTPAPTEPPIQAFDHPNNFSSSLLPGWLEL